MAENSQTTLSKTEQNLWNAIVSESMAQLKYSAFALKALEEGHPEVAQVFQETAGAENIHGINQLKTAGAVKSTAENLRSVTTGEAKEIASLYPRMIRDALDEGRMDAAQAFAVAMDRERYHLESFMRALDLLEKKMGKQPEAAPSIALPPRPMSIPEAQVQQMASAAPAMEPNRPVAPIEATAPAYGRAMREVEREKTRLAAVRRIREVVFGAQDGLMSTLALVTALSASVSANSTVVVGGLATALAGMVSMATGTYLGSKAEQEAFKAEIEKEAKELEANPAEEMAELVFLYHQQGMSYAQARDLAEHIAADKELWLRTLVEKELGISPDVLGNPVKDALTMGAVFILAAMVPILPFFWMEGNAAIGVAAGLALTALFGLGTAKGRVVKRRPLMQGLEVLIIGTAAAGVGYLLGEGIPRLIN
ncbi:MAG: hypothetical protein FJ039_04630 [Chloroflexi bacterium]|nr:hypothetical protein [Chloroflexota bacterium]